MPDQASPNRINEVERKALNSDSSKTLRSKVSRGRVAAKFEVRSSKRQKTLMLMAWLCVCCSGLRGYKRMRNTRRSERSQTRESNVLDAWAFSKAATTSRFLAQRGLPNENTHGAHAWVSSSNAYFALITYMWKYICLSSECSFSRFAIRGGCETKAFPSNFNKANRVCWSSLNFVSVGQVASRDPFGSMHLQLPDWAFLMRRYTYGWYGHW